MKRILLCTDLDRTLIPNGVQPISAGAKERFERLAGRKEITLAYVTGRHRALIEQAITRFDLPQPDFAIADVGSSIYQIDSTGWRQWDDWDMEIAPDWQGLSHAELYLLLDGFSELRLQEKAKQNRHKLSFYIPLTTDIQSLIAKMEAQLQRAEIKANLIWSIDKAQNIGLLDVLPVSANKLHAIHFLMQCKGFQHKNTVFAGDSGNDLDVLISDIPAVLVANADSDVRQLASNADKDTLYLAKGGYLGMNGNYCAGILEGAAHFLPEVDTWLREMN